MIEDTYKYFRLTSQLLIAHILLFLLKILYYEVFFFFFFLLRTVLSIK
jgi:hypothetical protein